MTQKFDYIKSRAVGDRLVTKFGMLAKLRRDGVDRDCTVCFPEYLSREQRAELANPTERQVYIAAGLGGVPALPPHNELDQLVTFVQPPSKPPVIDEILPFTGMPVKPISPAGIVVLYQLAVRQ